MENNHLTAIKIENFKRFALLEVEDLGQFNLIVGDNNTGKTCLLEALCVLDAEMTTEAVIYNLYHFALGSRNVLESNKAEEAHLSVQYHYDLLKNRNSKNDAEIIFSAKKEIGGLLRGIRMGNGRLAVKSTKTPEKIAGAQGWYNADYGLTVTEQPAHYVTLAENLLYNKESVQIFTQKVQKSRRLLAEFIETLQIFIPNIEDIRIVENAIYIYEKDQDMPFPLSVYGLGSNKLFNTLIEFSQTPEGGIFIIDEVDSGIHFSRFGVFWKSLLRLAIQKNVQLFAATHNIECIRYFEEVLKHEPAFQAYQQGVRVISLRERPQDPQAIYARVYNFEELQFAQENEHEIRGGKL